MDESDFYFNKSGSNSSTPGFGEPKLNLSKFNDFLGIKSLGNMPADNVNYNIGPAESKQKGMFDIEGLGKNLNTLTLALGGINSIGNIWAAFEAAKLAKKQFNATKEFANANLNNSIMSYNTALSDRARSRAVVESQTPQQEKDYITANSLKR